MNLDDAGKHQSDLIGRFAQHKVAANLLMLIMLISGIIGLLKLNTQFLPNFALDFITVRVIWPGAAAEDVATSITTPLEQELRDLDSIKEMRSTSTRGVSLIVLEYEEGSDMSLALDQVKERVSVVRNLPSDSEDPQISKVTRYEDVAQLVVTSSESLFELRSLVREFERELLDQGIAKINFVGLPEEEIAIQVPSTQLHALKRSLPELGALITAQSQDIPAGTTGRKESERELRSLQKQTDEDGFRRLAILTTATGLQLRLGDIANIERRPQDQTVEVFYKGEPAILMQIKRTESADTLEMADIFNRWLEDTRPTLPPSVQLHPVSEAYVLIEDRISLLLKNGLGGLVLVVGILFIFLNGRVAFWVALGIPVSFMGTLAVMYLAGGSINMVSLFALIMALGIIVDDAIVVGEDALTHYNSGENSLRAAEGGARRMFVPVMSSSLTTIAAFLPLMIIGGIIGNILVAIPIVIICVIIASLIESFLVLPGHLRHSFHRNHHKKPGPFRQKLDDWFNNIRDRRFRPLVTVALNNRLYTLILVFCLFAFALSLLISGRLQFTFFPTPENTFLIGSVKFAAGTPAEKVEAYAHRMEEALWETNETLKENETDLVLHSLVRINTGSFDGGQNFQSGDQYATVQAELASPDQRNIRNYDIVKTWESKLPSIDGIEQLSITSPRGGPPGKDIDVFLRNAAPDRLKAAAEEVMTALRTFEGASNIQDDLPYGKQQFIYKLTPTGQALGLSVADVGRQLRAAFDGQLLQIINENEDEIEVRIVLPDTERDHQSALTSFPIITPQREVVLLENVIELESRRGLELLRHTDGKLGIHVTAEVDASITNANTVLDELDTSVMRAIANNYGLVYEFKGKAEEQRDTGLDMMFGAVIGISLIYVILAWVFASYFWPLAVMAAIPFGLTGAIIGHWLMGLDLTILSLFGFFGLSGIVVNDSIILVTFYQDQRQKGMPRTQALIEASCQRLRAVLLTSLTTIAGLLPLLFETSLQAQFLIPMAVSISFGLAFATILVLVVIPVILSLIEGIIERSQKWWKTAPPSEAT
ncbi:efflux RND transporter permease subunit [Hahella ganghwensis]|uniref:efflux RND transporter permease subunit n=1 Tax=Hahella ganghwensis TaxID=286420 RepID=UPI00035E0FF9|nr:efflux RND transporter permease subunit [Hahella ganghwensis]